MQKCSMERLNIFGHWLNKWCIFGLDSFTWAHSMRLILLVWTPRILYWLLLLLLLLLLCVHPIIVGINVHSIFFHQTVTNSEVKSTDEKATTTTTTTMNNNRRFYGYYSIPLFISFSLSPADVPLLLLLWLLFFGFVSMTLHFRNIYGQTNGVYLVWAIPIIESSHKHTGPVHRGLLHIKYQKCNCPPAA